MRRPTAPHPSRNCNHVANPPSCEPASPVPHRKGVETSRRVGRGLATLAWVGLIFVSALRGQQTLVVPTQFPTIQSAITAAAHGDRIEVRSGVYREAIDFQAKRITVEGAGADSTVIDATGLGTSAVVIENVNQAPGAVLRRVTVTGGSATGNNAQGGGIRIQSDFVLIDECTIDRNTAMVSGGGILAIVVHGQVRMRRCLITRNTLTSMAGGSAMAVFTFFPNQMILDRCTFSQNAGPGCLSIGYMGTNGLRLVNVIGWANNGQFISSSSPPPAVSYSCIEGGYPGTGNTSADPRFVSLIDFRLQRISPCIDTGDPATELDPDRSRADIGCFHHPHPLANFTKFGRGCGAAGTVPDLGAVPGSYPSIGTVFQVLVTTIPRSPSMGVMELGASNTAYLSWPLPLDMTFFGLTGCFLYQSREVAAPLFNGGGQASWSIAIPTSMSLVGSSVFLQSYFPDASANQLGLAISNGGAALLGM